MVCRYFILPEFCKPCLFSCLFHFAQLIVPYHLYGKEIRVFFYKKLRDEIKFPSLAALQAEIRRNADETRAYFAK